MRAYGTSCRSDAEVAPCLCARLPPDVKAAAEKAAREDTRSLSSFLEKLLTDHLRAKGYLRGSER